MAGKGFLLADRLTRPNGPSTDRPPALADVRAFEALSGALTHPIVRVAPAIPLRYRSRGWDLVWVHLRTDGAATVRMRHHDRFQQLWVPVEELRLRLQEACDFFFVHFPVNPPWWGTAALATALDAMLTRGHVDEGISLSVAAPFVDLLGVICGEWQMGRAALAAQDKLDGSQDDGAYSNHVVGLARFYAVHIAPLARAHLQTVLAAEAAACVFADALP